jgi:hypothetical protein
MAKPMRQSTSSTSTSASMSASASASPGPIHHTRKEGRRPVEVTAFLTVEGRLVSVRTRDISRSGICLISDSELPRDLELGVALVLSLGQEATSEPLHLTGKTAWSTPMFGKYQNGVMFVDLDADRRRYLDLFIRFVEGEVGPAASEGDSDRLSPAGVALEDLDDPFRP